MTAMDALNMVLWLAGFAAFVTYYGTSGTPVLFQAIVAFAVLEW